MLSALVRMAMDRTDNPTRGAEPDAQDRESQKQMCEALRKVHQQKTRSTLLENKQGSGTCTFTHLVRADGKQQERANPTGFTDTIHQLCHSLSHPLGQLRASKNKANSLLTVLFGKNVCLP